MNIMWSSTKRKVGRVEERKERERENDRRLEGRKEE